MSAFYEVTGHKSQEEGGISPSLDTAGIHGDVIDEEYDYRAATASPAHHHRPPPMDDDDEPCDPAEEEERNAFHSQLQVDEEDGEGEEGDRIGHEELPQPLRPHPSKQHHASPRMHSQMAYPNRDNPEQGAATTGVAEGDSVQSAGATMGVGGAGGRDNVTAAEEEEDVTEDDAVLDLAQMEQLQEEAERMKGLGNRHMAAQEYTRAYNAYSAALQLSPVGPTSHVFLSNRAAALLSLKRYSAAAVDARRAVALAPTFGKAHARLGQALYFLKDYAGAVAAYEEAVTYEPENRVTGTYLAKARGKLARKEEREARKARGEEVSVAEESANHTVVNSIATDPNASAAVVSGQNLRSSSVMLQGFVRDEFNNNNNGGGGGGSPPTEVRTGAMGGPAQAKPPTLLEEVAEEGNNAQDEEEDDDDPDFDEAVRLQRRAARYLSSKQYRHAIDEFSAALFLVPDDEVLSPQLYVGRAHALNGSRRHESAKNDCRLALQLNPRNSDAYSALAKCMFYLKDFGAAVSAFERSAQLLGPGEEASVFDRAYLQKAREALRAEEMEKEMLAGMDGESREHDPNDSSVGGRSGGGSGSGSMSVSTGASVVPKLKPPRFVPREELINSAPNLPPMPKAWPTQSLTPAPAFRVGPERKVTFLSDSLGIKLNRGTDGIVRVLSVAPDVAGSPIVREGDIESGDVIREAAGVDIRRPITNIMWGDTVALVRMSPRPITLVVAREMSEPPKAVLEEMARGGFHGGESRSHRGVLSMSCAPGPAGGVGQVRQGTEGGPGVVYSSMIRPSPASGEESVAASMAATAESEDPFLHSVMQPSPVSGEESVADLVPATEKQKARNTAVDDDGATTDSARAPADKEEQETKEKDVAPTAGDASAREEGRVADTEVKDANVAMGDSGVSPNGMSSKDDDTKDVGMSKESAVDAEDGTQEVKESAGAAAGAVEDAVERDDALHTPPPASSVEADAPSATAKDDGTHVDAKDTAPVETGMVNASKEKSAPVVVGSISNKDAEQENLSAYTGPSGDTSLRLSSRLSIQDQEIQALEGEILFGPPDSSSTSHGWTNDKWLATSSTRKLRHCGLVTRLVKGRFFFSRENYVPRTLAVFENPNLILILRLPKNVAEVRQFLGLPKDIDLTGDGKKNDRAILIESFLVAESVVDPKTCKLRLSPLTTVTSVESPTQIGGHKKGSGTGGKPNMRRSTCFELITPTETVVLSAVVTKDEAKEFKKKNSFDVSSSLNSNSDHHFDRTFLETSCFEVAIGRALHAAHGPSFEVLAKTQSDQAWKHQVVLGTLHSFVVAGNVEMLRKALDAARRGSSSHEEANHTGDSSDSDSDDEEESIDPHIDASVIDAKDEGGRTALHYACHRRASPIVSLLVSAGANCAMPTEPDLKTPAHLSAGNLDEKSLSTILSATYPVRPDPNALDAAGRTPMYVAAVDGRAVGGTGDPIALGLCLSALEAWGGQMVLENPDTVDLDGMLRHPVSCVAGEWRSSELTVVLSHCQYTYPLPASSSSVERIDAKGNPMSVGAMYHYPMHAALMALRRHIFAVSQGKGGSIFDSDEMSNERALVSTLRALAEHGFEANERIEGLVSPDELDELFGFTPLQILGAAALDASELETLSAKPIPFSTMRNITDVISGAADILIKNGARLAVDPPPEQRGPHRVASSSSLSGGMSLSRRNSSTVSDEAHTLLPVDRGGLKLDGNKIILEYFGGSNRLRSARNVWNQIKSVKSSGRILLEKTNSVVSDSSADVPGGNDAKSCAICWKQFGALTNRKHLCRVTNRYVCDDCSGKRVVENGEEYRVCDGQFTLAKMEAARCVSERRDVEREETRLRRMKVAQAQAERYNRSVRETEGGGGQMMSADTDADGKDELFGGVVGRAVNYIMGEEDEQADPQSAVSDVAVSLTQTKDALNERGDKLNTLSDKTAALMEQSRDFANMAKELEKSQKSSFW